MTITFRGCIIVLAITYCNALIGCTLSLCATGGNGRCCNTDEDCDDAIYCNGFETCKEGNCLAGNAPCDNVPDCETCNEEARVCIEVQCSRDDACDNGQFCDGVERCVECQCRQDNPPCLRPDGCDLCVEELRVCGDGCENDEDCDDFLFCTGIERCVDCLCFSGTPPCNTGCDENTRQCSGP